MTASSCFEQGLQAVGAHLVIGRERALDEIEVAQHRLARQRRVVGDEADRLAPAAVVQQRDAAGGGAVLQDDAAGAVGELDRQVELDARHVVVRAEAALRQAEGASVAIEGAQADRLRHADLRARDAGPQAVGVALRRQQHQRQVELQAHHVERAVLPQGVAEGAVGLRLLAGEPVAEPEDVEVGRQVRLVEAGRGGGAVARPGRRFHRRQLRRRGRGRHRRQAEAGVARPAARWWR